MKILFLSRWFPYPTNNGSRLRIYNLLRALSRAHKVTLLSFSDEPDQDPDAAEVRAVFSEVHVIPWKEFDPASPKARMGFLSLTPRSIIDTFSDEMAREIRRLLNGAEYDLVIASQFPMAAYYPYFKGTPALFEELELGLSLEDTHQAMSWIKKLRHSLTWFKQRGYLNRVFHAFRGVTVVSHRERELALRLFPNLPNVSVVPNCVNYEDYASVPADRKPGRIVFTGSFRYHANYEAMRWFVGEVFPLVLKHMPAAELVITGDPAGLPLPSQDNIDLAGHVEDIREVITSAEVAIAPLWSGGGTRLKILEAMALGTPVVATTKGAEGLEVMNGEHLLISDDPAGFADHILALLQDPALRGRMANCARSLVMEKYAWERTGPEFVRLVESLAGSKLLAEWNYG